jgi:hypothetical protein
MEWLEKLYSPGDPPELVVGKLMTISIVTLIVWVIREIIRETVVSSIDSDE